MAAHEDATVDHRETAHLVGSTGRRTTLRPRSTGSVCPTPPAAPTPARTTLTSMAAIIQPLLEKRYRRLEHETGPKKPRGWQAVDIAREFVDAVDAFEPKMRGTGPFYPEGKRKPLPNPDTVLRDKDLGGTNDLAALLAERPRFKVDRRPLLDFRYVDREIAASRALDPTGKAHYQASRVKLDFLLVNADDATPIAAEAKLNDDPKDPEAALLQALMYASLLAPSGQRERLPVAYPDLFRFGTPERVDVYVLIYKLSKSRRPLLESAMDLAKDLGTHGDLAPYLRRIAFIEAYLKVGKLRFRALGRPVEVSGSRA